MFVKILFICHHWPVPMFSLLWSSHFFYMYLFSLFLLMIFSFAQKISHLKLWLDLTLPTVWMSDEKLIHFNWTWHTNMNMKEMHTGNSNNIKNVKENILNLKLFSGNTVQNKIKLCCNPLMQMFLLSSLACNVKECYCITYNYIYI